MLTANRLRGVPAGGGGYGEFLRNESGPTLNSPSMDYDSSRGLYIAFHGSRIYTGTSFTNLSDQGYLGFFAPSEATTYWAASDKYIGLRFGRIYQLTPGTTSSIQIGTISPYTNRHGSCVIGDIFYLCHSGGVKSEDLSTSIETSLSLTGYPDDEGSGRTLIPFDLATVKGNQLWVYYHYSGSDSFGYIAKMNPDGSYAGEYFQCQNVVSSYKYLMWHDNEFYLVDASNNPTVYVYSGDV